MDNCLVCESDSFDDYLEIGDCPISNRYQDNEGGSFDKVPLGIKQCNNCGLVQLTHVVDYAQIVPSVDWIRYIEPEPHLDELSNIIVGLSKGHEKLIVCGVTEKDGSLLERVGGSQLAETYMIDANDLGISNKRQGIETVQYIFSEKFDENIFLKYASPDVIVARHIFEHAHNPYGFMQTLKMMALKKDAHIVLEVPDYSKSFDRLDYSAIWEEHTMYFTENTLCNVVEYYGFSVEQLHKFNYDYEDCLVVILKHKKNKSDFLIRNEVGIIAKYTSYFSLARRQVREYMLAKKKCGRVAIYGTGHSAVMFMHIFDAEDFVDYAIDDSYHKINKYLPGTSLIIEKSEVLYSHGVTFCLLAVGAEGEIAIMNKHAGFIDNGGGFESIFKILMLLYGSIDK